MMLIFHDAVQSITFAGLLLAISLALYCIIGLATKIIFFIVERWSFHYVEISGANLWAGLPLGVAGMIAGFITGLSRAPAVSALVPAALTLTGGVALYLIRKDRSQAVAVGLAIIAFSLNLLVGTNLGSVSRERVSAQKTSLEYLRRQADDEFLLLRHRKGLGLQPPPTGAKAPASLPPSQ